jgi:predicted CoA-binding protein
MSNVDPIDRFFESASFGVVGASANRKKYGNRVLLKYRQKGLIVYPVNPTGGLIEGLPALKNVKELPPDTKSISIITHPEVTEQIAREAVEKGIRNVWMQPGAESATAVAYLQEHGVNVIADGSCVIVVLGIRTLDRRNS